MKSWIYLLVITCAISIAISSKEKEEETSVSSSQTVEYLNRKLREIKVDIAKSYSPDNYLDRAYDIRWDRLWEKNVNSNNPLALSFFNETFVLADERVLRVELEVSDKVMLREVALISQQKSARFVRTIAWKESLYLLICRDDGSCTLHVGPNADDLRYRQIVKHRGLPMDAKFFTQVNHLYLVVADNSGQFSVPSVIYRWTGTYMDVIAEIGTTGAISVTTFNHKQSTIIIFAQNVQGRPRIGSEVFKIKNGIVEKIQFLSTDAPVSIHHYVYEEKIFLLIINEQSAGSVFWWDGKEFLYWMELPDIKSPTKVSILYVEDDTLLLVAKQNTLSLYRIMNLAYMKLNLLEMKDKYMITDFNVRVKRNSISLVLVTKSEGKYCTIEPYELVVKKFVEGGPPEEADPTWQHLEHLDKLLKDRKPGIERSRESWPSLLSFSENLVIPSSLELENVIMDSGDISNLLVSSPEDILTPTELGSGLEQINRIADSLISRSRDFIFPNDTGTLFSREVVVLVEGDAFFDEMHVDSLNVGLLNGGEVEFDGILSYSKNQDFSKSLEGNIVKIQNLEVDSLCGIPFENWLMTNDNRQSALDSAARDKVKILNDTVFIQSDIFLDNLGALRMNNLNLNEFFADLFIVGINQQIKGSIFYKSGLNAFDLTINATNGIEAENLLTKTTDQKIGDFTIRSLEVEDLYVESINNVSVNQAARISQKNVVSGPVTFRSLRITEELVVAGVSMLFDLRPIQIYDTVKINGNLVARSFDLISSSSFYLEGKDVDVNSMFVNYWTKSTDQTMTDDFTITGGISIDDLHADYLNGFGEDDFLYTTAEDIPEKFGPLYFKELEINGLLIADGREPVESVSSVSENALIVNQKIFISNFTVNNLNARSYNEVPVENIIAEVKNVITKIPGRIKYENLKVNSLEVDELLVKFFNDRDMENFFEEVLLVDGDYAIDNLEMKKLETVNILEIEELSGLKMKDFNRMLMYKDITGIKSVTIDGNLLVTGNLDVEIINDMETSDFIDLLSNSDVKLKGDEIFERFVVHGNLSSNLLRGINIEDLAKNTLSKTKNQKITGKYTIQNARADYLVSEKMNDFDLSNLKLVSDPLIFEEDVTFSDLIVKGDIITSYFNDGDVAEIYEEALRVPLNRIANLTIIGNMNWEDPAMELKSLSYIFSNAVRKNTNQTISGEVIFEDCICAYRLTRGGKIEEEGEGLLNISSIILDAVIPTGQTILIKGKKLLKRGLETSKLRVIKNIDIADINGFNILDLNSSIVRKFDDEKITGAKIFRGDVTIERFEVEGKVHGLFTGGIVTFNETLPSDTIFANLKIQNDVHANKLDGINFDEFLTSRVTLDGNQATYSDLVFTDSVTVAENAALSTINGINISDVVLNESEEAQIISGGKIFVKDLIVHGRVNVVTINKIPVIEEYKNGIFNNEDVNINGDIIFAEDFETLSNVSVSGSINGIDLKKLSEDMPKEVLSLVKKLDRDQTSIEKMIDKSLNHTKYLQDIFFYFDEQPELLINAPNIRKVESFRILGDEVMTKLNLYGTEKGGHCSLPDHCPCPTQYVVELTDNECKIWKINGSRIIRNVHDPEDRYGVNIITDAISSSPICTRKDDFNLDKEFTTISWMVPRVLSTGEIIGEIKNNSLKIRGYLSDVKTFTIGAKLYIVLAIYYISELRSHEVNTLVYEIDLNISEIKLSQEIRTSGAIALDVFATELHGMHLLIACEKYPGVSQLHRFNIRNSKFELLRTFRTGGSRNVKNIIQGKESFILIDDPLANSVHIFNYNIKYDNYHVYQSLYHESPVNNIQVFYSGEFGASEAFVIVTTDEGRFFVYEYMFFGGFQLRAQQWLDGVQAMGEFQFSNRRYIFAGTIANSTVYRIIEQGPNYN